MNHPFFTFSTYVNLTRLATPRQTVSLQRPESDTRPPVNPVKSGFLPEESPGSKGAVLVNGQTV